MSDGADEQDPSEKPKGIDRLELEAWRDMGSALRDAGIFRVDLVTGELHWDDVVRGLYGIPAGQRVTVELALEAVHPDDRAAVRRKLDAISSGLHPHFEHSYRVLDHRIRYLYVRGRTHFDAEGRPVMLMGSVRAVDELGDPSARQGGASQEAQETGEFTGPG